MCDISDAQSVDSASLVTVHPPRGGSDLRVALFYLHGGGLVYGERDDLPKIYLDLMVERGYTVIAADYPLAPEYGLPCIVESITRTLIRHVFSLIESGELDGYVLFGRSAGAYLSLLLARRLRGMGPSVPQPRGVLDFYGYYDLSDPALRQPAAAYAALPEVTPQQVKRITQPAGTPVTSGPKALRYALYVYARQHEGAWLDLLGLDGSSPSRRIETWSLDEDDLRGLPPLFIAASTGDEDIPYRISKTLWRTADPAVLKTAYYLPHDFDRDISRPDGERIYRQALDWLDTL